LFWLEEKKIEKVLCRGCVAAGVRENVAMFP
jgi:hypothetical protein